MQFKATRSDRGLRVLEKGFLPTLEKLGKRCQLLLTPEVSWLLHGVLPALPAPAWPCLPMLLCLHRLQGNQAAVSPPCAATCLELACRMCT